MATLLDSHLESCPLTCCCASCKSTVAVYTYKAGDDREGLVHDDRNVETDDSEMSASCILATSTRDRQGDIIECSGVDFTEHTWNPIVLWDHGRQRNIPIGLTESSKGEYTVLYHPDEDVITQKTYFAPDEFSRQIYVLVRDRYIRANSIAVKDLQVEKLSPDPDNGHFKVGKWIKKSALAEVTWTPLPANAEAVASLITAGKIDGGGFARETLHPLILKSLSPFVGPQKVWVNGLTLKSQTAGPAPETKKGEKSMPENLRRKNEEETPLDAEPETPEEEGRKEMPPGAAHLHDHHDLLMAHKAMLEEAKRHQENPGVREIIDAHKDMLDTMGQETRDKFGEEYPDHEGPKEEKSEEPREQDTPEAVGDKERVDKQRGGNRVEEEKSVKKKTGLSKKAVDFMDEATRRTYQRTQADFYAEQQELAELEAELAKIEAGQQ